ncbi:MAG: SGNH/GDSL hydrolase family protein [Kiritimatiellia bacterium]
MVLYLELMVLLNIAHEETPLIKSPGKSNVWLRRAKLALVFAGVVLGSMVGAEFVVRVFFPHNIVPCPYDIDPRIGPRFRPNSAWIQRGATGEVRAWVRLNSCGLRSPELDSRPRIMLIGDSFTWGAAVPQEKIFAYLLQAQLPQYQVVNYAMWAHAPPDYWAVYHYFKEEAKPVGVIVGFFEGNDFVASSRLVRKTDSGYFFVPYDPPSRTFAVLRRIADGRLLWFLETRSQLFNWLKDSFYLLFFPPHAPEFSLDFTFDMLKGLTDEAQADGVPVSILIIPVPPDFPAELWPGPAYTDALVARLRAAGIHVVDLRPYLGDRQLFFFRNDDRHFNEEGHRIAAEVILREVFGSGNPSRDR